MSESKFVSTQALIAYTVPDHLKFSSDTIEIMLDIKDEKAKKDLRESLGYSQNSSVNFKHVLIPVIEVTNEEEENVPIPINVTPVAIEIDPMNVYPLFYCDCKNLEINKKDMYERYKKYCEVNKFKPDSEDEFHIKIKSLFDLKNDLYIKIK